MNQIVIRNHQIYVFEDSEGMKIFLDSIPILITQAQIVNGVFFIQYTGWPIKNGTVYFPQYLDAITSISV